jgi:hypothetical protein
VGVGRAPSQSSLEPFACPREGIGKRPLMSGRFHLRLPAMRTAFRIGSLLLLAGVVVAVATWPHAQTDALGDTRYPNSVANDIGLVLASLGFVTVVVVWIARGLRRYEDINQDSKP